MKAIKETNFGKSTLRLLKTDSGYAGVVLLNGAVTARVDGNGEDEVETEDGSLNAE